MKVAVISYTGGVGKTTIAAQMLAPRMGDAPVFAIESINETAAGLGVDVEQIRGERFRDLFKSLLALDSAIIDVGASNVEDFFDGMAKFEDSHLEIDRFIIPVTNETKSQKETISVINTLAENFGVESQRIHLVFNKVGADVAEEFSMILRFSGKEKTCVANPAAAIYENELYDLLAARQMSVAAAISDETDYKAKLRELGKDGDPKLKAKYADLHAIKAMARAVDRNLDAVYSIVMA